MATSAELVLFKTALHQIPTVILESLGTDIPPHVQDLIIENSKTAERTPASSPRGSHGEGAGMAPAPSTSPTGAAGRPTTAGSVTLGSPRR